MVALGHRDFRRFWLAALVSNTGGWMQNAAVPYVTFQLTGNAGDVGITGPRAEGGWPVCAAV